MGQRANLIVVENGKYELYYDHWCANSLDAYLFWGVSKALEFFKSHEKQGENWWLDDVWCEGGAVIDLDKKKLLWFGSEDILYDVTLRRLLIELMQKNWKGFDILWAYEGVAELADYVGYDRAKVLTTFDDKEIFDIEKILRVFKPTEDNNYWDCAVSIRNENNTIEIYTAYISTYLKEFLYSGTELLNIRQGAEYLTEYTDDPDSENALHSGIHIDLMDKTVDVWSSDFYIFDYGRLADVWEGYKILYHQDRFEVHAALTGERIRFNIQERSTLITKVKQIACRDEKDPLDTLNSLVGRLAEQEKEIKISPAAFMASKFKSNKKSQEKRFDRLYGGDHRWTIFKK